MKTRGLSSKPIKDMSLAFVPGSLITFRQSSSLRSTISHLPPSITLSLLFLFSTTVPELLSRLQPRLRR